MGNYEDIIDDIFGPQPNNSKLREIFASARKKIVESNSVSEGPVTDANKCLIEDKTRGREYRSKNG